MNSKTAKVLNRRAEAELTLELEKLSADVRDKILPGQIQAARNHLKRFFKRIWRETPAPKRAVLRRRFKRETQEVQFRTR